MFVIFVNYFPKIKLVHIKNFFALLCLVFSTKEGFFCVLFCVIL